MVNKNAVIAGAKEAVVEAFKLIPVVSSLIEGVREYHNYIEEQQKREFVKLLTERVEQLEQHKAWYATEDGERFVRKTVATALNAEYADKLEYLANALVNGPSLGGEDARRLKFIEMIRSLSKPALDVLVASLKSPSGTGQIDVGDLATSMKWEPELVDACVRELYAEGAYSSVTTWKHSRDGSYAKERYFQDGTPAKTPLTDQFAQFITKK